MSSELDRTARNGEAAPLEGAVGREVAGVLNLAFGVMQMNMCLNLAHTIGLGLQGPMTGPQLSTFNPSALNPVSQMAMTAMAGPRTLMNTNATPSFLTMKPPSFK